MSRRYPVPAVLNVEGQIRRKLDIARAKKSFESVNDALVRNRKLVKTLSAGDDVQRDLSAKLAACDHKTGNPCGLVICHVCGRENRRLFVADGLDVLGLTPDDDPSTSAHLFVTMIDHHWVRTRRDFQKFDMLSNGNKLVERLKGADLKIHGMVGAWDFEWRRWTLNDDPPWKQRFWVPHVHAVVKTSLEIKKFRARLRAQFERKVLFSVERPTHVTKVTEPFGALSYVRKMMFFQREISELHPASRHQNPTGLEPDKVRRLCVKLHEQGYKSRHVLIGCRVRKGRIKSTD
jgi:hypothetical protein